jgi:excisionase family DNA binding protein
MPWRNDFVQTFWLDPDWVGLSGYPDQEEEPEGQPVEHPGGLVPNRVIRTYPTYRKTETERHIGAAVIVIRDRIGFEYERQVGLNDFVSIREAAKLLELPVMTLTRWVKSKKLRSSKRSGFVVIRLREVLRIAKERRAKLKLGFRLIVLE